MTDTAPARPASPRHEALSDVLVELRFPAGRWDQTGLQIEITGTHPQPRRHRRLSTNVQSRACSIHAKPR